MNGAKVLVIKDQSENQRKTLKKALKGKNIQFIWATSENEAKTRIAECSINGWLQLDAIIISDFLGIHETSTALIKEFTTTFLGNIIGISEKESFQERLKKAGCHYVCDYDSLPQVLLYVLGL
jgi:DNA-binding NtrC family response regulator